MFTRKGIQAGFAVMLLAWLSLAQAARPVWERDDSAGDDVDASVTWVEKNVPMPAYPDGKHYLAIPVRLVGSDLEMFIDEPSLTLGEDRVVRYTLLLRSPRGNENLFYEGIRCTTREWRSYAYGASSGAWQVLAETPWKPILGEGFDRYREQLFSYYLCNSTVGPLSRDEMLNRIRYDAPREY